MGGDRPDGLAGQRHLGLKISRAKSVRNPCHAVVDAGVRSQRVRMQPRRHGTGAAREFRVRVGRRWYPGVAGFDGHAGDGGTNRRLKYLFLEEVWFYVEE